MSDAPVSPRAQRLATPSWLDARLVLGVLLVLVSVVVGASVLSRAEAPTYRVYAVARDVPAGITLTDADFRAETVALDAEQAQRFVPVDEDGGPPQGFTALRALTRDDLLLRSSLVDPAAFDLRQFTLNVDPGHAPPDLRAGDQVDVYVTPDADRVRAQAAQGGQQAPARAGQAPDQARVVLRGVAVQTVGGRDEGGFGGGGGAQAVPVVLNLAPGDVLPMVRAVATGQVDLVRVYGRRAAQLTPTPAPAPSASAGAPGSSAAGRSAPSPTPTVR